MEVPMTLSPPTDLRTDHLMDLHKTRSEPGPDVTDALPDAERAAAEHALEIAQRNPILSGEQACAVAQVYALLAIERRLAQLFAAFATPGGPSDLRAAGAAVAVLS
jgi:hypothetical protein